MSATTVPVSAPAVIDPDLNIYDRAAVLRERDAFFKEQLVRTQEILVVQDKLKWCYRREGVNYQQNCRHLAMQYLDLLKEVKSGWIKPFVLPEAKQ